MAEKSKRLANIEILRIAAMFFIVFSHIKFLFFKPDMVTGTERFGEILTNIGIFAVDLFVLISGYFSISNTKFGFGQFFKILAETIFYSVLITILFMIFGKGDLKPNIIELLKSFDPLAPTHFNYWFVSRYLCLMLFAPFLARFAQSLTKRQYKALILVMLFVCGSFCAAFPLGFYLCNPHGVLWFCVVFLVGGYIRLHYPLELSKRNIWMIVFIAVSIVGLTLSKFKWYDFSNNSILTLLSAVSLFCLFRTFQFGKSTTTINFCASHVFAAYLIQEQPYFKGMIKYIGENYFPIEVTCHLYYTLCVTVIILVFAICLDFVRSAIFKNSGLDNLIKNFSEWCLATLRKWCS